MIETVPETGSTNADLLALLAADETIPEGYWLSADRQSAGRGRGGREWMDGARNLHASTVVTLRSDDPAAQTLAFMVGLAVYRFVIGSMFDHDRGKVSLKWPNDVLIDGAKVAGILLERQGATIVCGVGINLHSAPSLVGRETTHISRHNPKYEASQHLAATVLARDFAEELGRWRNEGAEATMARWSAAAHPLGTVLAVHQQDGSKQTGTYDGLSQDGALRLRLPDGSVSVMHVGDVMLEDR